MAGGDTAADRSLEELRLVALILPASSGDGHRRADELAARSRSGLRDTTATPIRPGIGQMSWCADA